MSKNEIIDVSVENTSTDLTFDDIQIETPLSLVERKIAELKLKAYSPTRISQELEIPETQVKKILNRKAVKEFINKAMSQIKSSIKDELVALHLKIIEDKIKYIEEKHNGDFSKATKKDLPDLVKMLDDILKEEEKAKLGTTQNVYVNVLNQVLNK